MTSLCNIYIPYGLCLPKKFFVSLWCINFILPIIHIVPTQNDDFFSSVLLSARCLWKDKVYFVMAMDLVVYCEVETSVHYNADINEQTFLVLLM